VPRPALEVADIFRDHGPAWRQANVGHVSLDQFKVMSAIENCRTAALGGHVLRCENCSHIEIAYNSCLMGKFRNGESADNFLGLTVDFTDFALHYGQSLGYDGQLVLRSKGSFARMLQSKASMASGPRPHAFPWCCGVESTNRRSEDSVPPKARSRKRGYLGVHVVMESKRQPDQRGNTRNIIRCPSSQAASSPLRNLPIRQVMGIAHYLS
jgi:Transposase zinc-binding domain